MKLAFIDRIGFYSHYSKMPFLSIQNIDTSNFDNLVGRYDYVVIEFTADWCQACKSISRAYTELAATFHRVLFASIDIEKNYNLAKQFSVSSLPTFLVFYRRAPISSFIGTNQLNRIKATLHNNGAQ